MHALVCVYNHTGIGYLQLTLPAAHANAGVYITRVCFSFIWTIVSPSINPIAYILLLLQIMIEVGKGFSYSTIVLSTGPLLRLWVAPRLTDYHTLSLGPQPGLQCPPKVSHRTTVTLPSRISQPKFTLLLCRV